MNTVLFIPLLLLPLFFILKLLNANETLALWLSFFFASFTFTLTLNSIASVFVLIFALIVLYTSLNGIIKVTIKKRVPNAYIVVMCDNDRGVVYLSDGYKVIERNVLSCDSFYVGDVVKIN